MIERSDDIAAEALLKSQMPMALFRAGKTNRTHALVEQLVAQLVDRHTLHRPVIRYAHELRGRS